MTGTHTRYKVYAGETVALSISIGDIAHVLYRLLRREGPPWHTQRQHLETSHSGSVFILQLNAEGQFRKKGGQINTHLKLLFL